METTTPKHRASLIDGISQTPVDYQPKHRAVPQLVDSHEVSQQRLEYVAHVLRVPIELPGSSGGWARVTTPRGRRFHAWVPAVKAVS